MNLSGELASLPPALTPEQHRLFVLHPYIPRRAVEAVVAELGYEAADDAMLRVAVRGAVEAAVTFEVARGVSYDQWALFYAVGRLFDWLRSEHGEDKDLLARIRRAMVRFLAHERMVVDPWKVTRESGQRMLGGFADSVLMSGMMQWSGVQAMLASGEGGVEKVEEAANAGDALRKVVGELRPEQRRLITRCAAYDEPVKKAAEEADKGYRAVLREYHDLLALMGARMGGLKITGTPAWMAEVSGEVFEDPATPANDEGRGE